MNEHLYRKLPVQITVKQLVARIAAEGMPTCLAWSDEQMNSRVPGHMEEWPTGTIPKVVVNAAESVDGPPRILASSRIDTPVRAKFT